MSNLSQRIHFNMAFIGGYLGVHAVLSFGNLLGNAQTSNLISVVTSLLSADWTQLLLRLGGMLLYMAAIALTVYLPSRLPWDLRLISVALDAAAAVMVGFFPTDIYPVLGLYPLFFAMAFQWNSFPGADGFVSSSIFSTHTLRQFTRAMTEVLANHDPTHLPKAAFFGKTLLSFHAGVAASFLLWRVLGPHSAWLCLVPCASALYLVCTHIRRGQNAGAAF